MGAGMSGILANAAGGGGLLAGLFSGGAAPLVGIAGQFLQGIFNRNAANRERQQSIEDVRQQFVRLREAAELGGYNPLAVLGMGSGIPASRSGAYMGSAIADSALMMADSMQRNGEASRASRVSALEMANADLQERLTRATLRPTVGGVYQRPAVLSHPMAGGGNASQLSAAVDGGGAGGYGPRVVPVGPASSDSATLPPTNELYLLGQPFYPRSGTSDFQSFSDRYGEDFGSPGWFAGWGSFAVDAVRAPLDAAKRFARNEIPFGPGPLNFYARDWARITEPRRDPRAWSRFAAPAGRSLALNPPSMGRTVSPRFPLGF